MKKTIIILFVISTFCLCAQTSSFDTLNANVGINKSINWTSSIWGNGFGHKLYNADPGGGTQLRIAGRNNTTEWTDIMSVTSTGNVGIGTTVPGALLHLHGSDDGRSYTSFQIGNDPDAHNNFHWVNSDWDAGVGRALYLFNGNLGSGTTLLSITPTGDFKINGNVEIDGKLAVDGQKYSDTSIDEATANIVKTYLENGTQMAQFASSVRISSTPYIITPDELIDLVKSVKKALLNPDEE